MKDYDKNKELSFLQYWDANNLYGQAILQKLPVNNFQISFQFNEDFIKNYNDESNVRYLFEADVQYLEKLRELHNDLLFLPKRLKIEKVASQLVTNLHDKNESVIHIRNLREALKHGLGF